jgi:hypothetical protein
MKLTTGQRRDFVGDGFVVVEDVVPPSVRRRALRSINAAFGAGGADRVTNDVFTGHENCDPLQHSEVLLGLATETPALSLAEQVTEPGALESVHCCQMATRFPDPLPDPILPVPDIPHIDGIPNRTNGLPAGQLSPFSVLVGVYLSDLRDEFSGNLVVWPGSHRTIESYVRSHPEGWLDPDGYGPVPLGLPPMALGEPVQLRLRAGSIVLAHYQLAHAVSANRSPDIRYAVYFRLRHRDLGYDWEQLADIWSCHPALDDITSGHRA